MTMIINIKGITLNKRINIDNVASYVILADTNGKQLKRTSSKQGHNVTWDNNSVFCTDTLNSIFLYVYHKQLYRRDLLVAIGKFDFNQARNSPYEKKQYEIPISLQGFQMGNIYIQGQFNEGQIYIGVSSHLEMGKIAQKPSSFDKTSFTNQQITKNTSKVFIAVSPLYPYYQSVGLPQTQDGLIQLQIKDFFPTYNIFSMLDVHQPHTKFVPIQPHLRRTYHQ